MALAGGQLTREENNGIVRVIFTDANGRQGAWRDNKTPQAHEIAVEAGEDPQSSYTAVPVTFDGEQPVEKTGTKEVGVFDPLEQVIG